MPYLALLTLSAASFVVIMTETVPAGLLGQIAPDLGVGQGAAGQLVGAYAIGTVLSAIPSVALTRGIDRRPLLLVGILGFAAANAVTAASASFVVVLIARAVAGAFSGLLWSLVPDYARSIAPAGRAGRALAIASVGTPLGLALGTPLGSAVGAQVGWRWTFWALSAVAMALGVIARVSVPQAHGRDVGARRPLRGLVRAPGMAAVLLVCAGWMLAHNALYTYAASLEALEDATLGVDVVLLLFGAAAVVGVVVIGTQVDRRPRTSVVASLLAFLVACLTLALGGLPASGFIAALVVWGLSFGGASTLLQTAAADIAGGESDASAALVTTAWNAAIFGGSATGGILLGVGARAIPIAGALFVLAALMVAARARHALPPGPRQPR